MITPVALPTDTVMSALLHTPVPAASLRVIALPAHTVVAPVMAAIGATVTTRVAVQLPIV